MSERSAGPERTQALLTGAVLAAALLLPACATNPVTGRQDFVLLSEEEEIRLGREYSSKIVTEMPPYDDPELAALVQEVGERLAANSHRPDLIYRFTVLDSTTVNAFALPGGYIYITRGMLAYLNSEAQLAAVLGHEIGHVTARHSVRQHSASTVTGLLGAVIAAGTGIQGVDQLTSLAGTALVRGYGREHELEADRLGAEYLARTGYDPNGMLKVIGILKNQESFDRRIAEREGREPHAYHGLFSTHPDNDKRLQEVVAAAHGRAPTQDAVTGRERYLEAIDGLVFGHRDEEGIARNSSFYHADLDFALQFPDGWRIENESDRVVAVAPDNNALVQLKLTDLNRRITPAEFMRQRMKLDDMEKGETLTVAGFDGYTAVATAETPWGKRPVRFAVLFRDNRAWVFAAAAKDNRLMRSHEAAMLDTVRSYRALDEQERELAREQRIAIIRTTANVRYAALAQSSPLPFYAEEQLRLLNGHYPAGEPGGNALIKIVR